MEHASTDGFSDLDIDDEAQDKHVTSSAPQVQHGCALDVYGEEVGDDAEGLDDLFEEDGDVQDADRDGFNGQIQGENDDFASSMPPNEQHAGLHDQFLRGQALLPFEFRDNVVHDVSAFAVTPSKLAEWHNAGVEHNAWMNHGFSAAQGIDIRSLAQEFLQVHASGQ